jgi:hypothetical protein
MLSLVDLRRAALAARDAAVAEERKRAENAHKIALQLLTARIMETASSRYGLAPAELPAPEVCVQFDAFSKDFTMADAERLISALPSDFKGEVARRHYTRCDCERADPCTPYIHVTWTWE